MATAYAAFTSLMHLISDLREHPYPPIILEDEHFDSLNQQISFFQKFLEDHHTSIDFELELRIADAAYAAEDVIETHIADEDFDQEDFNGSLQKVIEAMDIIEKEVSEMNWNAEKKIQGSNQHRRPVNSAGENIVVGMEDLTIKIVDKLTRPHQGSGRQIISITGMGGIGKTTLAKKVYNHPYVSNYFDVRAWATISKDYNIHESLIELLHCLNRTQSKESLRGKGEYELGDKLYKDLFGKRYLLIMDDIWGVEAWDRLRSFFPDSRNSGVVITTRQARFDSINSHAFAVGLLDTRQTWDLFCKTVFRQDDCPRELEDVGKEIAENCRGLPLSVVVIGGHLAKSPRTQEYWESIPKILSSVVNSENNNSCMKILSLSYVHLPIHLKPCFLYLGIFPEDGDIEVSKLIRLWVAEGFLKPICGKSLEDVAHDYIHDLVDRNLILVAKSSRRGEIVKCKIHDLLRDLCLKEALMKKFLCIARKKEPPNNERRIVLYPSSYEVDAADNVQKPSLTIRTLMLHESLLPSAVHKSLRVLASAQSLAISGYDLVEFVCQLVNLRCLYFSTSKWGNSITFPSSFFSIWSLQCLDMTGFGPAKAPIEIWKMSQLRHINVTEGFRLSGPPPGESGEIMKNLQSVETILNLSFGENLVKRIPSIMSLRVIYKDDVDGFSEGTYALNNIERLENLEKFCCWLTWVKPGAQRNEMVSSLTFPHSLKELTVSGLRWDDVTTKIGSLPLLEELHVEECSGSEWELVEGQFVRLKCLEIYFCGDLECFIADSSHFPCLEELILFYTDGLNEISSDVGDIQTLRYIELKYCQDSAVESVKEIAEYQKHEMGNEELQVNVRLPYRSSLSAESLSASNFIVQA